MIAMWACLQAAGFILLTISRVCCTCYRFTIHAKDYMDDFVQLLSRFANETPAVSQNSLPAGSGNFGDYS